MDKTYQTPNRLSKLHDELGAASITPTLVEGDSDGASVGTWVRIVAPQTVAAVDAVVAAHDPTTPSPVDVQETADRANAKALSQMVDTMVPRLDAIQADMVTLGNHAQTLSTITVTSLAQVQGALRSLGTDLMIFTDDVKSLAIGSERILKALDAVIRRLGG